MRAKTSEFDVANFSFGIDQHNRWAGQSRSGEQRFDHVPMDIGQSSINAIVTDGQALVIDAQQVQHGGMDVIDLCRVIAVQRLVAPLVAWAIGNPTLNPTATEPIGKDIRIVVPAFASLGRRHATKFGGPKDKGLI